MVEDIHSILTGKWTDGSRPRDVYERVVVRKPETYVGAIMAGLEARSRRIQGGCAELASLLSADRPDLLYPHVDLFLSNLSAPEPVVRWEAACTVGNLAAVDVRRRIPRSLDALVSLLDHESIVLQGHAARALGKIGRAFPDLAPAVLDALFSRSRRFPGSRIGCVIEAAGLLADVPAARAKLRRRVEPYTKSGVASVAAKARRVLKRLSPKPSSRRSPAA